MIGLLLNIQKMWSYVDWFKKDWYYYWHILIVISNKKNQDWYDQDWYDRDWYDRNWNRKPKF